MSICENILNIFAGSVETWLWLGTVGAKASIPTTIVVGITRGPIRHETPTNNGAKLNCHMECASGIYFYSFALKYILYLKCSEPQDQRSL